MASGSYLYVHQGKSEFSWIFQLFIKLRHASHENIWLTSQLYYFFFFFKVVPPAEQASEGPRGFVCRPPERRQDHQRLRQVCGTAWGLHQVIVL